eukprot:m.113576 g.113576  ORF g.113576 m.113576 type:complete len:651 (-) comp14137_c0_seq2:99-2051(-)
MMDDSHLYKTTFAYSRRIPSNLSPSNLQEWESLTRETAKLGYTRISVELSSLRITPSQFKSLLNKNGLQLIVFIEPARGIKVLQKSDISDNNFFQFQSSLNKALEFQPDIVCSRSGHDSFDLKDAVGYLEQIEIEADLVAGETRLVHASTPGTVFGNPWMTLSILEKLPNIRIALDIGAWSFACGRTLDIEQDRHWWPDLLKKVAGNVELISAGIGDGYCSRMAHPSASKKQLASHVKSWNYLVTCMDNLNTLKKIAPKKCVVDVDILNSESHGLPLTNITPVNIYDAQNSMMQIFKEKVENDGNTGLAKHGVHHKDYAQLPLTKQAIADTITALQSAVSQAMDYKTNVFSKTQWEHVYDLPSENDHEMYLCALDGATKRKAKRQRVEQDAPVPGATNLIERSQQSTTVKEIVYYALDDETPEMIAQKHSINVDDIMQLNQRWKRLKPTSKFKEQTPVIIKREVQKKEQGKVKAPTVEQPSAAHLQNWKEASKLAREDVGEHPRKGTKAYEVAKSYKSQIDVYGSVRHRYKEGGDPVPDPASVIQAGYISESGSSSQGDGEDGHDSDSSDGTSEYFIYYAEDDETPGRIARAYDIDVKDVLRINKKRISGLRSQSRLKENTAILLPISVEVALGTEQAKQNAANEKASKG